MLICIDAGHGAHDPGACGNGLEEKDINLQLALLLNKKLKSIGVETSMVRNDDTFMSINKRVAFANPSDLLISIHCNSGSETSTGFETWVSKGSPGSTKEMAHTIHYNVHQATKKWIERDRGLKLRPDSGKEKLGVLTDTKCHAVLIECGFISNPSEAKVLINKEYQEALTDALVISVIEIFKLNVKYPPTTTKHNVLFKGKPYTLEMENVNGKNRIYIAELNKLGFKVGYEKGMVTID